MLKIRLMGTKGDIEWFQKLMKNQLQVKVIETSHLYTKKGTTTKNRSKMEINTRKTTEQ